MTLREIWRRFTTTRYTRALEGEVAWQGAEIERLRTENRALLNSILGIAGIPRILVEGDSADATGNSVFAATGSPATERAQHAVPLQAEAGTGGRANGRSAVHQVAAPLRRRSWQQISRMFEFEAARKAVTSD